jgi:hypothetical protein
MASLFRLASSKSSLEAEMQDFYSWLQEKIPDITNEVPDSRAWFKSDISVPFITTEKSTNVEASVPPMWSLKDVLDDEGGHAGGSCGSGVKEDGIEGETGADQEADQEANDQASSDGMDVDNDANGNDEPEGAGCETEDCAEAAGVNVQANHEKEKDNDQASNDGMDVDNDANGNDEPEGRGCEIEDCAEAAEVNVQANHEKEKDNVEESHGELGNDEGNYEEDPVEGDAEANHDNESQMDTNERRCSKEDDAEKRNEATNFSGEERGDSEISNDSNPKVRDKLKRSRKPKARRPNAGKVISKHDRNTNAKPVKERKRSRGDTIAGSSKESAIDVDVIFVGDFFDCFTNILTDLL